MDIPPTLILTPYNYFEWKPKTLLLLGSRALYRITMAMKVEPNSAIDKSKFFNIVDEAFRILYLSISP